MIILLNPAKGCFTLPLSQISKYVVYEKHVYAFRLSDTATEDGEVNYYAINFEKAPSTSNKYISIQKTMQLHS